MSTAAIFNVSFFICVNVQELRQSMDTVLDLEVRFVFWFPEALACFPARM